MLTVNYTSLINSGVDCSICLSSILPPRHSTLQIKTNNLPTIPRHQSLAYMEHRRFTMEHILPPLEEKVLLRCGDFPRSRISCGDETTFGKRFARISRRCPQGTPELGLGIFIHFSITRITIIPGLFIHTSLYAACWRGTR
jgi:hypothetical protein